MDVIIDFSSASAIENYEKAAQYGTRIVSAISKYDRVHLDQLKDLSKQTAVLYSPNITLGINFLIEASKYCKGSLPTLISKLSKNISGIKRMSPGQR